MKTYIVNYEGKEYEFTGVLTVSESGVGTISDGACNSLNSGIIAVIPYGAFIRETKFVNFDPLYEQFKLVNNIYGITFIINFIDYLKEKHPELIAEISKNVSKDNENK